MLTVEQFVKQWPVTRWGGNGSWRYTIFYWCPGREFETKQEAINTAYAAYKATFTA